MSVQSIGHVLDRSRSVGQVRCVLIAIANHDGDGGAWPSIDTIAREANVHPRTAQKHLRTLVSMGELVIHQQQGGTLRTHPSKRPNRYEITLAPPGDVAAPPPGDVATPPPGDVATRTVLGTIPITTPLPPEPDEGPPEALSRLWGGEGISKDEQQAMWSMLVEDPETLMPLHRGKQPAWIVWALAQVRAKNRADTGAAVQQLRAYGPECEHGTPGGTSRHPATGLPLCPLCRASRAVP